jgi:hypothetical protein
MAFSVLLPACGISITTVRGSGNVASETRDVSGFDEIELTGSGRVNVSVTGTESLIVEADDNILPILETEVRNGRLVLGSKQSYSTTNGVVYTITATNLTRVSVSGSGDFMITGVDTDLFSVDLSGSGEVEAVGESRRLDVSISGSGDFRGDGLVTRDGEVSVSGSGYALVNATDFLEVAVSGSGDVEYLGSPELSVSESGSGEVSPKE